MRFSLLIVFISFLSLHSQVKKDLVIPPHPKIGLSLAGGGAKGFAHVGVLKVLDSLGVKIDYISGTSMGAIVGGLYASGYNAKDIEKFVMETDFYTLLANEKTRQETSLFNKTNDKYLVTFPVKEGKLIVVPKAISTGQKNIYMLKEIFSNVSNVSDFSKLPIPFLCIGTNLENGNMKVFDKGDLVASIMASSAYPGLLDPVKVGDSLYIDGAMTVNYPSEELKKRGIDIVIGVDLYQPLSKKEDLNSAISILNQIIDFNTKKETQRQYAYTDINIKPDLNEYNATSYGDKKIILDRGYEEGNKYINILNQLPKRRIHALRAPINTIFSNVYKIDSLVIKNNKLFNKDYVQGKMNLKIPSLQTYDNINTMVDKLYATNNYNLINYYIIEKDDKNILQLTVSEDSSRFFLKLGLHYDEVFETGLLLNGTVKNLLLKNSILSLDGVVGYRPRYYFNYFVDNGFIPGIGLYSSAMGLNLKDNNKNTTEDWTWLRNDIYFQSTWKDRFAIGGGISYDYFKIENTEQQIKINYSYFNPYLYIRSDSRDDREFASRGLSLNVKAKIVDFFNEDVDNKVLQIKASANLNFPLASFFTYRINVHGGFSIGNELPYPYQYRLGGIFDQNISNFIPFYGYQFGSLLSNNVFLLGNEFQFKIHKNYFLTANISAFSIFEKIYLRDMFKVDDFSAGITAAYRSPVGQVKINFSKSNNFKKGVFSVILGHWF